ncbi:MAG: UDP-N-acetylglucosamine 1-carboxyvinyltransferase [Chloroflexi bacterium]|nr:UDP-N-acetylglucosamine 1-carboxyvinyltransferase [Chloroflexota bacterium]
MEPLYRVQGGGPLRGDVGASGAKNAALPCLAATLLTAEPCTIRNLPDIADVGGLLAILSQLGAEVDHDPAAHRVTVRAAGPLAEAPPDQLVGNQRASFLVMGPLLAREGRGACAAPGGDLIGQRPLDVHLRGFRALGADVRTEAGRFVASGRLRGARMVLDYPSVLGTENLMLAAVRAEGETVIVNAAAEPEVAALADLLCAMGARIRGAGSHTITVTGVAALHGADYTLIPDRIEAGTFAVAAAITGGDVRIHDVRPRHLEALLSKLREIGVEIDEDDEALRVRRRGPLQATTAQAVPYPGLATDLQALVTTLLTQAEGVSTVNERVFENRLGYVAELRKMGARIVTAGSAAIVQGPTPLHGAVVQGLDVRASAALVVAALVADGETELRDVVHLERGYEDFGEKLRGLGAVIERRGVAPETPRA